MSYSFRRKFSEYIEIQPESGEIFPNEKIDVKFLYKCVTGAPDEIFATCDLRVVEKLNVLVGTNYTQNFIIFVESGYAELCSIPKSQDFGVVKLGNNLHTSFHLFNYGDASVNFKLTSFNLSSNRDNVKILPTIGEVRPKQNIKIDLEVHFNSIGNNEMQIVYEEAELAIADRSRTKQIFKVNYICEIFTFLVVEIVFHSFGHIFGVHHMWNLLKVDRINELLKKGWYGDKRIDIFLPECEENPDTHLVVLCLRNVSKFESEIRLKRKKLCNCSLKEVKDSFNATKSVYDCPHRGILTLQLSDKTFYSRRYLTFRIKYTIVGTTEMAYILSLEDGRSMELHIYVTTIPKRTGKISLYAQTFSMKLNSLYLALYRGVIQTFWLYNNTTVATKYSINSEDIEVICQKYGTRVLELLNPEGELEPNQMLPIMIKFHPVTSKMYSVELPIALGKEESQLKITGFATVSKEENICKHTVQISQQNLKNFVMAITTPQYLVFDRITDWSKFEQILCIENLTNDKILEYAWSNITLKQIVDINTSPNSGILAPKESHRIFITVKTYNESVLTDLLMTCTITDRNELYLYNKSIEKYQEVERKLEGQFMITENSFVIPVNTVIVRENPKPQILNVPIHLKVTYWKDAEKIWNEAERFSITPSNIIKFNVSKLFDKTKTFCFFGGIVNVEHKEDLKFILEQIISDIVFSRSLLDLLKCAKYQPPPYYTQFIIEDKAFYKSGRRTSLDKNMLDECRHEEIEQVFSRPAPSVLADILKLLIFDGIHYNFELGATYPTPLTEKQINEKIVTLQNVNSCISSCPCKSPEILYSKMKIL